MVYERNAGGDSGGVKYFGELVQSALPQGNGTAKNYFIGNDGTRITEQEKERARTRRNAFALR